MAKEQITLDAGALEALVQANVKAALATARTGTPAEEDPLQRQLREAAEINGTPQVVTYRKMFSRETGAEFTAKVIASRAYPKGRIVDIGGKEDGSRDYVIPESYLKHADEGGLVPNNIPIRNTQTGQFTREYQSWLAPQNPFIQDIRRYNGQPWNERLATPDERAA